MEVFRISKTNYAYQLTSSGIANRWNREGQRVIYAGSSRSLATLELIAHKTSIQPTIPYKVMVISIADDPDLVRQVNTRNLPTNWQSETTEQDATQRIGSAWYIQKESLLLKVPSAIIPYEYNYVINTGHPDFISKVQLVRTEDYSWDKRLLL